MYSYDFCKNVKNTVFKEHLQTTAPNFRIEFFDVNNWLSDSPNVHS